MSVLERVHFPSIHSVLEPERQFMVPIQGNTRSSLFAVGTYGTDHENDGSFPATTGIVTV